MIATGIAAAGTTTAQARDARGTGHEVGSGHGTSTLGPLKDRWLESRVTRSANREARRALTSALASARAIYRAALDESGQSARDREVARRAYLADVSLALRAFDAATLPADVLPAVSAYRSAIANASESLRASIVATRDALRRSMSAARDQLTEDLASAAGAEDRTAAYSAFRASVTAARESHLAALKVAKDAVQTAVAAARSDLAAALPPR
jgi:hypothetical protein